MDQPVGSALRHSRALILATVALVFGLVAHVTAGGRLPGAEVIALLLVSLFLVNTWLLGRPARALRLCVLLVSEQAFAHGVLTSAAGHASESAVATSAAKADASSAPAALPSQSAGAEGRTGSFREFVQAAQVPESATLAVPASVQHLLADITGPNTVMVVAHVLAAVAVGLWLARGEQALWTVVGLSRHGIHAVLTYRFVSLDLAARVSIVAGATTSLPRARWHEHTLPPRVALMHRVVLHRGPPALLPF